ncbi:MAG: ATP-binding protein [Cyclobacteriaceae bacterium]
MYFKLTILAILACLQMAMGQGDDKYITNYSPEINRSGEAIYAMAIDGEGLLYFATANGVLVYDGEKWQMFSSEELIEVRSMTYDARTDRVYVGGLTTFGYLEKNATSRYKYVSLSDSLKLEHPIKTVWQILLDEDKVMFQSADGFFLFSGESINLMKMKNAFIYKVEDRVYVSQTGGAIFELRQDSLHSIWNKPIPKEEVVFNAMKWKENEDIFFFIGMGILSRDLKTNQISPFEHPWSELVKKYKYYYGTMVSDSLFAMATWADGIVLTDLNGRIVDVWNEDDGLNSNGTYHLLVDGFGKLWLATEYGISTIDLGVIMPNEISQSIPKSKIVSMLTNNNLITYTTSPQDTFHLDRRPDFFRLEFTTPSLSYFADSTYQYMLEGYDSAWITIQGKNFAAYERVPNGEYTFKVKSVWADGGSGEGTLVVLIHEPWYAMLLGTSGYILIALLGVIIIALLIMNNYRNRQKLLVKLVHEKTKEIERHKQELIVTNNHLMETNEELDTFLYRSSHDLVSPVKSIKGLINLLKLSEGNQTEYIPMLEERIGKLENVLLEINGYVKSSKSHSVLESFNLKQLVDGAWSELEFMEGASQIKFSSEIDSSVAFTSDREGWRTIISNLLSNAIKYHDLKKEKPFIKVGTSYVNGVIELEVEDNGQGVPDELQGRLFEMFYRAHEISTGSGLGLFLVKKMVNKLNGHIEIDSKYKLGTKVKITVPSSKQV